MVEGPYPFPDYIKSARAMIFVDGENLAIRFKAELAGRKPLEHVVYEPDVFVWSEYLSMREHRHCEVIRRHYYTSVTGADAKQLEIASRLREVGIEAPEIFKRTESRGSKQVDIALATDMLAHGFRHNYDVAVLVAGDEDYVPLVRALKAAGRRVFLWFVEDGLSKALRREADYFYNVGRILLNPRAPLHWGGSVTLSPLPEGYE